VRRPHYHHPLTPVWNALIMGVWFAVVVTLLDILKWTQANLEATVLQRTEKLQDEIEERRRVEDQLTQTNADLRVIRQQLQESLTDLRKSHTELQHTQLQLIEAAKMESIGRMAAGIAHEVKNPLMTLSLGADYLFERGSSRHDEVELIKDMKDAVQRASGIINLLMDYSKPRPLQLVNEDINSIIESSLELMRHQLNKHHVDVVRQLQSGLPPLLLDKRRMQHVFLNLFTNAVQAMSAGGTLRVRTCAEADPMSEGPGGGAGGGSGRIIVEVEDTGPGVPQEHIASLFEPFFTTKGPGEGTGLGLSIVQRLVKIHGGSIAVGNCPEGGARFVLTFNYRAKG
jgi:signal transduction histidine kinase